MNNLAAMSRKKLPPFGSDLYKFLDVGNRSTNDVYLFCGIYAWRKALFFKQYRYCLLLPPYESPCNYHWPVNGCDVLVFETGNLEIFEIEEICYFLLKAGASIVRALNSDFEMAVFSGVPR